MSEEINKLLEKKESIQNKSFNICNKKTFTEEEEQFLAVCPQMIVELEDRIEDLVNINNVQNSFTLTNIEKLKAKIKLARQAAYIHKYRAKKKRINIVVESAFYSDISLLAIRHDKTITRVLREGFKLYQEKYSLEDLC